MDNIEKNIERNVVLYTSIFVAILSFSASISNYYLNLGYIITILSFFISIIYTALALYIKKNGLNKSLKIFITLFSLLLINLTWIYNFQSKGPILGYFILIYIFIIFIWNRKQALIFAILTFINLLILVFYEYNNYNQFQSYNDEKTRILDVYIGLFFVLLIIHFYTVYLKHNYQKQYKKAKESDELKSAFLANLSHEIRTPLNSIIGFSDLITNMELTTPDKVKYNEIIQSNSSDLLSLIEDIVDLSLIESNGIKLVKTNFSLNKLLENLHFEYTVNNEISNAVELNYYSKNSNINLYSDVLRFKQIVKNLINNAIKYTPEGNISFGFKIEENFAVIFVANTGIGIKESDKDQIFNRFMKIESNTEI